MKDPALGRTRAERALGESHPNRKAAPKKIIKKKTKPKAKNKVSQADDVRVIHNGQYDGPRASYGRYNVARTATDGLNRQKRNMDAR